MVSELITEQLTGMVPDLVAVSTLILIAMIIMRSFKLMSYSAEFDKQYKAAAATAHKTGDKAFFAVDDVAWKNEYIANRAGGVKRYNHQKKQRAAFNNSRTYSATSKTNKINKTKPQATLEKKIIRPNNFKMIPIKIKYGVSNNKALYGQRLDKEGKRHFAQPATPHQQRELNAGRDPQTIHQFRDEMKGKKFNPEKFNTNTGKTLSNIRQSRERNGKVFN